MNAEKFLKSYDGTRIYYRIIRKKKPFLFFVHGLSGNCSGWKYQLDFFERLGYSTITMDIRGHGYSEIPKEKDGFKLEAFVQDINDILKKEKINKIVLIGHCFGGIVCERFCSLFPKKVEKLILINTGYKNPYTETAVKGIGKLIWVLKAFYASLLFLVENTIFKKFNYRRMDCNAYVNYPNWYIMTMSTLFFTHPITILNCQKTLMDVDSTKVLKKIKVPTFILSGDKDGFFPVKIQNEMHKLIKNSKLKIIKTKHLSIMKVPDEVNSIVFEFIKGKKE